MAALLCCLDGTTRLIEWGTPLCSVMQQRHDVVLRQCHRGGDHVETRYLPNQSIGVFMKDEKMMDVPDNNAAVGSIFRMHDRIVECLRGGATPSCWSLKPPQVVALTCPHVEDCVIPGDVSVWLYTGLPPVCVPATNEVAYVGFDTVITEANPSSEPYRQLLMTRDVLFAACPEPQCQLECQARAYRSKWPDFDEFMQAIAGVTHYAMEDRTVVVRANHTCPSSPRSFFLVPSHDDVKVPVFCPEVWRRAEDGKVERYRDEGPPLYAIVLRSTDGVLLALVNDGHLHLWVFDVYGTGHPLHCPGLNVDILATSPGATILETVRDRGVYRGVCFYGRLTEDDEAPALDWAILDTLGPDANVLAKLRQVQSAWIATVQVSVRTTPPSRNDYSCFILRRQAMTDDDWDQEMLESLTLLSESITAMSENRPLTSEQEAIVEQSLADHDAPVPPTRLTRALKWLERRLSESIESSPETDLLRVMWTVVNDAT